MVEHYATQHENTGCSRCIVFWPYLPFFSIVQLQGSCTAGSICKTQQVKQDVGRLTNSSSVSGESMQALFASTDLTVTYFLLQLVQSFDEVEVSWISGEKPVFQYLHASVNTAFVFSGSQSAIPINIANPSHQHLAVGFSVLITSQKLVLNCENGGLSLLFKGLNKGKNLKLRYYAGIAPTLV